MFTLGLLLPVCFWSGITGLSLPTQWALLSAALPLSMWRSGPWTLLHWLGAIFIAYAVLSLRWTLNIYDGIGGLWLIGLWALSFWLGSTLTSLDGFFRGLAWGLILNTGVQISQWFGYSPTFVMAGNYAGLLFNQTVTGAALGLCIVGLACYNRWRLIPLLLPGLWLAHSRAGWLIIIVAAIAKRLSPIYAILILATTALIIAVAPIDLSDSYRLQVWALAAKNITLWGWGPGSFYSLVMVSKGQVITPEFAHNDYIQLLFEYGVFGLIPIAILAIALTQRHCREWPIAVAFAALACVYFPLQHAMVAAIGALATGCISRDLHLLRRARPFCRPPIVPGSYIAQHIIARDRRQSFSL